jgi:hypothetical protein
MPCFYTGDPTKTDLFELVKLHLGGISGGQELSAVLLRFHQALKTGPQEKVHFITGFCLSYRCLDQTLKTMRYLVEQGGNPVQSLVWSVLRNYGAAVATAEDHSRIRRLLGDELKREDVAFKESYRTLPELERDEKQKWQVESKEATYLMRQLENRISMILLLTLSVLRNSDSINDGASRFVQGALRRFFLLKYPNDASLQNAVDDCPPGAQELKPWIEKRLLPILKDRRFGEFDVVPQWNARRELIEYLKVTCDNLQGQSGEIFMYLERASYHDILERGKEVFRMRSVLANINQVLYFEGDLTGCSLDPELKKFLQQTASIVSHLETTVSTAHSWALNMKPTWVDSVYNDFTSALEESKNTAALHMFHIQLNGRIKNGALGWPALDSMVQSLVRATGCAQESLMPYSVVLQWQGFDWEFILNPVYRMLSITPPSLDFLTRQNILRMEEDHCIETLQSEINDIIDDSNGLKSIFNNFSQKSRTLEKKLEEGQRMLMERHRILKQGERDYNRTKSEMERLETKEESLQQDIASLEEVLAQPQAASQAHEKQDRQVLYMVWYSLLRVVYVYYRT